MHNSYRTGRMIIALEYAQGFPGNEGVQYEQLRLIMHDARACGIPIIDWLLKQTALAVGQLTTSAQSIPENSDFSCSQCAASFKTKAALNGHQRVHKKGGDTP